MEASAVFDAMRATIRDAEAAMRPGAIVPAVFKVVGGESDVDQIRFSKTNNEWRISVMLRGGLSREWILLQDASLSVRLECLPLLPDLRSSVQAAGADALLRAQEVVKSTRAALGLPEIA